MQLKQKLTNYCPWANVSPGPVLFFVCLLSFELSCFLSFFLAHSLRMAFAFLNGFIQNSYLSSFHNVFYFVSWLAKPKNFLFGPLPKTFANPFTKLS